MAFSDHKAEEEKKEYFDTKDEIEEKVADLIHLIKLSKNFIAFTGGIYNMLMQIAGISTAAGAADYRSGASAAMAAGPAVWEKQSAQARPQKEKEVKSFSKSTVAASSFPTYSHMVLVSMMEAGYLKFVVSQNADGLHLKSGIPPDKLAELHGNGNIEKCKKCGQVYLRDYQVRTAEQLHDHMTGAKCSVMGCNGDLYDTIVNFGEPLAEHELQEGFDMCSNADLCLVLGTSLRAIPASDMPATTPLCGGKLVIVK